MEKILAIVVLIVFVWWAVPFIAHGEWIAPTPIAPGSWVTTYQPAAALAGSQRTTELAQAYSQPSTGYGWFRFDFWNMFGSNPDAPAEIHYPQGRVVTKSDLRLRSVASERASL